MNNKTRRTTKNMTISKIPISLLDCKSPGTLEYIDNKWWCVGEKTSTKRKPHNKTKKMKKLKKRKTNLLV